MYQVKGTIYTSFFAAIEAAQKAGAEVYEVATNTRRWHPAPPVSAKRMRQYNEQLAAYEAQKKLNDRKT